MKTDPTKERSTRVVATRVGICTVAVLVVMGGACGGHSKSTAQKAVPAESTWTSTSTTTLVPTSTTVPAASASPTTTIPSKAPKVKHLTDTSKPVSVRGGTFVVISGNVTLTHIVAPGDTLSAISQWYKLMGGFAMLYKLNQSVIGSNPNLIYPGQVLSVTVPGAEIPKISPMYLAEARTDAKRASLH